MTTSRTRRTAAIITGALALTAGGLLVTGCGSSSETPPADATTQAAVPTDTSATEAAPMTYGEGDGPISVTPNQQFVIQLISGNGEQWQMTPTGDSIVSLADQAPGQGTSDMKSDRWTFDATNQGSATLDFTLYDKSGKKGKTVSFDVTVAP